MTAYEKYDGCEDCPYVEECTDKCGYTYMDEYGECPEDIED